MSEIKSFKEFEEKLNEVNIPSEKSETFIDALKNIVKKDDVLRADDDLLKNFLTNTFTSVSKSSITEEQIIATANKELEEIRRTPQYNNVRTTYEQNKVAANYGENDIEDKEKYAEIEQNFDDFFANWDNLTEEQKEEVTEMAIGKEASEALNNSNGKNVDKIDYEEKIKTVLKLYTDKDGIIHKDSPEPIQILAKVGVRINKYLELPHEELRIKLEEILDEILKDSPEKKADYLEAILGKGNLIEQIKSGELIEHIENLLNKSNGERNISNQRDVTIGKPMNQDMTNGINPDDLESLYDSAITPEPSDTLSKAVLKLYTDKDGNIDKGSTEPALILSLIGKKINGDLKLSPEELRIKLEGILDEILKDSPEKKADYLEAILGEGNLIEQIKSGKLNDSIIESLSNGEINISNTETQINATNGNAINQDMTSGMSTDDLESLYGSVTTPEPSDINLEESKEHIDLEEIVKILVKEIGEDVTAGNIKLSLYILKNAIKEKFDKEAIKNDGEKIDVSNIEGIKNTLQNEAKKGGDISKYLNVFLQNNIVDRMMKDIQTLTEQAQAISKDDEWKIVYSLQNIDNFLNTIDPESEKINLSELLENAKKLYQSKKLTDKEGQALEDRQGVNMEAGAVEQGPKKQENRENAKDKQPISGEASDSKTEQAKAQKKAEEETEAKKKAEKGEGRLEKKVVRLGFFAKIAKFFRNIGTEGIIGAFKKSFLEDEVQMLPAPLEKQITENNQQADKSISDEGKEKPKAKEVKSQTDENKDENNSEKNASGKNEKTPTQETPAKTTVNFDEKVSEKSIKNLIKSFERKTKIDLTKDKKEKNSKLEYSKIPDCTGKMNDKEFISIKHQYFYDKFIDNTIVLENDFYKISTKEGKVEDYQEYLSLDDGSTREFSMNFEEENKQGVASIITDESGKKIREAAEIGYGNVDFFKYSQPPKRLSKAYKENTGLSIIEYDKNKPKFIISIEESDENSKKSNSKEVKYVYDSKDAYINGKKPQMIYVSGIDGREGHSGMFRLHEGLYIDNATFEKGKDGKYTYDTKTYDEVMEIASKIPTVQLDRIEKTIRDGFELPDGVKEIYDETNNTRENNSFIPKVDEKTQKQLEETGRAAAEKNATNENKGEPIKESSESKLEDKDGGR